MSQRSSRRRGPPGLFLLPLGEITYEGIWKAMYVRGEIDLDRFENGIEVILRGGLPDGMFSGLLPPRGCDPGKVQS
jgi:hypothetical protein